MKKSKSQQSSIGCWVLFFLLFGGFIAGIIVLATYPYPVSSFYRATGRISRKNCTVGEIFDSDLDMCAPVMNTPIPISHELMDLSIRPCDSFFNHMSGKWIASHQNENRGFTYIFRRNQKHVHDIVTDPKSGPVYTFYRSCLDTLVHKQHSLLDKSQVKHVNEYILGSFMSHADLPVTLARLASYGFMSPFTIKIEAHPTRLAMIPLIRKGDIIVESGLPFPISMTYDLDEFVKKLSSWAVDKSLNDINFIDYVQGNQYPKDIIKMGALLDASPPDFWKLYLRELNGYVLEEDIDNAEQEIWSTDTLFLHSFLHGLKDISMREWKAFFKYSILVGTSEGAPRLEADSYFRIHSPLGRGGGRGSGGSGQYKQKHSSAEPIQASVCIDLVHKLLPGAIGNLYLQRNPIDHTQVTQLVEKTRDALARIIERTSWLSEKTRETLGEKIRSIIVRSVHPHFFEQEPFLERMTIDNYLRNLNIIRKYTYTRNFELWTKGTPNRDFIQRFGAPLTEVNAFYSPISNTITIFAGILNQPFYNERFPSVALYAIVAMVAGHEIGHAVDNNGILFDKDGSLYRKHPWNPSEIAEFVNRTKCMIDEFETPFGCNTKNYGEQTLGEDMADLIGVRAAYEGWIDSTGGNATKQEKQWFFQIFAQAWAETYDQEELCDRVENDVHAIANYRVDKTLRQMPEFREAFDCKVGDGMVNEVPCRIYG